MNTVTAPILQQTNETFTISGYGHTYQLTEAEFNAAMMAAESLDPNARPLTTGQVASMLKISTKTVARLLDAGRMPFYRNGENGHRMVRLRDVIAYQQERNRRHNLLERSRDLALHMGGYASEPLSDNTSDDTGVAQ